MLNKMLPNPGEVIVAKHEDEFSKYHIEHTYSSFLQNPSAQKGNSTFITAAQATLSKRNADFHKLDKSKFKFSATYVDDDVYLKVSIPSENADVSYDTVFCFKDGKGKSNLAPCLITFFSNAMSFVYTYAYAFRVCDLFIVSLEGKLPKESFNEYSKVRNPELTINFEKTITYGLLYLREKDLLRSSGYTPFLKDSDSFFGSIRDFHTIKSLYDQTKTKKKEQGSIDKKTGDIKKIGYIAAGRLVRHKYGGKKAATELERQKAELGIGGRKVDMKVKDRKVNNKANMKVDNKVNMKVKK